MRPHYHDSAAVLSFKLCSRMALNNRPQDLRFGAASGLPLPLMRSVAFPAYSRDQLVEALAVVG